MTDKVYAITEGEYSDYYVICLVEGKIEAEYVCGIVGERVQEIPFIKKRRRNEYKENKISQCKNALL